MQELEPHSYEEIRSVVVDILIGFEKTQYEVQQFLGLQSAVHEVFARRAQRDRTELRQSPQDRELIRDVFWDLFRQGAITLGLDSNNTNWPFFRLSYFGQKTLASQSPWRFHDTSSYLTLVRRDAPALSEQANVYLEEAVQAFYAQCLLASCVMLGVAAEAEFLRLLEDCEKFPNLGNRFSKASKKERMISGKIRQFLIAIDDIKADLGKQATEDLDINFTTIQSVLRIARNEAGHPSPSNPSRENVYVYLQLFVPFARQLFRLKDALREYDARMGQDT
jgi:hypothetical protein